MTTIAPCKFPRIIPRSPDFRITVDRQDVDVLQTVIFDGRSAAIGFVEANGALDVEVVCTKTPASITVRPLRLGITPQVDGNRVRFRLERPVDVWIDIAGQGYLFLCVAPPLTPPADGTPGVKRFAGGQVHEVGTLDLNDGEQVWLEPGAVLRGTIHAVGRKNVSIRGHGLIDGSYFQRPQHVRTLLFEECQNVLIEGIAVWRPTTWTTVFGACQDLAIRGMRVFSDHCGGDGIDICGCERVRISGGLIASNDDCIVIKSIDPRRPDGIEQRDWSRDVRDVEARGVTCINGPCGNALEIGHELRCKTVSDIRFIACDILQVMNMGAAISIHNGDHARIENILFEDIRIEHHYDCLFDLRVMKSRYSKTADRGSVSGVVFRRCTIDLSIFNAGYTTSTIGGWDEQHRIDGVVFEKCTHGGEPLASGQQMDLFVRHAGVEFKP